MSQTAIAVIEPKTNIVVSQDEIVMVDGFIINNPGPRWQFKSDDDIYELWIGQFESENCNSP